MMSILTEKHTRDVVAGTLKVSVGGGQPIAQTRDYVEGECQVKGKQTLEELKIFSEFCKLDYQ